MFVPHKTRRHNCNPCAFVDTLIILWYRRPPSELLSRLARQYGKRLQFKPLYKRKDDGPVPWVMKIQQPTVSTLEVLDEIQRQPWKVPPLVVNRVDVAVDFPCETAIEAEELTEFLRQHYLLKFKRRVHRGHQTQNVSYARNNAKARRNVVIYGDRPSKVAGTPCAHFEMRFRGAAACKAAGVGSIRALIEGVDVMAMLQHQSKLTVIDRQKLDRTVETIVRNTVWHCRGKYSFSQVLSRIRSLIMRGLQSGDDIALTWRNVSSVRSQEFYDSFPVLRGCLCSLGWEQVTSAPEWFVLSTGVRY